MQITHGARSAASPPVALTIGNFDGVHRGHQVMLERLVRQARERRLASCVLTFEPHPREFFERLQERSTTPDAAPPPAPTRLTNLREKLELLAAQGVERVHVLRFAPALAALTPEAFVEQVLWRALAARWILIGDDFRFGARRAGDISLLRAPAPGFGFEVEAMDTVEHAGSRVSSSVVRSALAAGDLRAAESLLGRPYSISGRVVHGNKLGRELGFATANVQLKHNRPPLMGIYAVRAHIEGAPALPGVASLGVRPTVRSDGQAVLEVHLFDFERDLYRHHMRVEFLHKIRDEARFADLDALKAQIARDCEEAKNYLASV
ncbi:MAG: bifunctional riboflavin kinase/FAD synthetase [Betaproteobacteria bacterium]|nr:bifunctional riboflavin kinase/FAD synthetase [Betaproteobacteria bacterium]